MDDGGPEGWHQLETRMHLHKTPPPATPANDYFHFDEANILMETWSAVVGTSVLDNPQGTVS